MTMEQRNQLQHQNRNRKRRSTITRDIAKEILQPKSKMKKQPAALMLILTTAASTTTTTTVKEEQEQEQGQEEDQTNHNNNTSSFHLNDHFDLVLEILSRLDGPSLAIAACVCRLWSSISRNDSLWESLCFRHLYHPSALYDHNSLRSLVISLGGYRSLYSLCVRPLHLLLTYRQQQQQQQQHRRRRLRPPPHRRGYPNHATMSSDSTRRAWTRHGAQLFLSLFCVDYYERQQLQQQQQQQGICSDAGGVSSSSSLMFLCKPVNV